VAALPLGYPIEPVFGVGPPSKKGAAAARRPHPFEPHFAGSVRLLALDVEVVQRWTAISPH
jgi:hypothetical protein